MILFLWGGSIVENLPGNILTVSCGKECFEFFAPYRICLGLIAYHALLLLILLGASTSKDPRFNIHERFWPLKIILWLGGFIGFFFVPSESLDGFWIAALIFSVIYLIIQAILLVGLAHDVAEKWINLYEETEKSFYKYSLIFVTLLLNSITITGSIVFYTRTTETVDKVVITVNLFLVVIQTIVSILPKIQQVNSRSGLLQPSIVSLYMTYLIGSTGLHGSIDSWPKYIGLILNFMAIGYTAYMTGSSSDEMGLGSSKDAETGSKDEEVDTNTEYNYSFFHFIFVLAAFYMALVITSWKQPYFNPNFISQSRDASYWLEVACSWAISGMFMFSLIAPIIFPDREFGYK